MRRIAAAANEVAEDLVELELSANGATVRQATGFHIGYALAHFNYFADLAEIYRWQRPARSRRFPRSGRRSCTASRSGVVGAIGAVELPAAVDLVEGRAGAGGRQQRRRQT